MMDDFFSVSMLRFMCVRRLFFLFGIRLCNLLDEYALKNVKRIQFDGSVFMILYVDKCKSIYSSSFKHERMQRAIKFACVCLCKNERERKRVYFLFIPLVSLGWIRFDFLWQEVNTLFLIWVQCIRSILTMCYVRLCTHDLIFYC